MVNYGKQKRTISIHADAKKVFTDTQKNFLNNHTYTAVARAKRLQEFQNPSTGVYKLIEMLQKDPRLSTKSI